MTRISFEYYTAQRPSLSFVLTHFLANGLACLSNNADERALRWGPLGCKARLFRSSDRGGQRAAILYKLIQIARLNNVVPQAWLDDVLAPSWRRFADPA